jgi:adenylyltransferase/sulfurtransferase
VLQYLAAAGIGILGILDDDLVDESNLQRQILFSLADVGKPKVEAAKERLMQQNPLIAYQTHQSRLTSANALEIIAQYDLVVDGSDNFPTRYLVNDVCVMLCKPLVFGSIFKFDGQVSVFNYQGGPTYRCLYPEPPPVEEMPNCAETGVLGVLPGICGTWMANEAIKIVCGIGETLSGKLFSFNALTAQTDIFQFDLNPENLKVAILPDYGIFCGTMEEITAGEFKNKILRKDDFQLIDVREESEFAAKNIGGLLIPLNQLAENLQKINPEKEIIVHCASGVRSKKAVKILLDNGFNQVRSLKNGLLDL